MDIWLTVLSLYSQLMITLKFYATGTFQATVGDLFGVDQGTTSRTITRVTRALLRRMSTYVHLPNQHEADIQKAEFFKMARFPNVIGCVDGTHIRIIAPSENEYEYVNRKNQHSINVQVRCVCYQLQVKERKDMI